MNHFMFSGHALQQGYVHSLITNHFCHTGFITYLIDSVIIYLFCQNLTMLYGPLNIAKTVILSMFLGSLAMFLQDRITGLPEPQEGNTAILRGLIFLLIFNNPSATLRLFPIPIDVPGYAIAGLILFLDFFWRYDFSAFGGVGAAYAMVYLL